MKIFGNLRGEVAKLWETVYQVISSKKFHMNMCLICDDYGLKNICTYRAS